MAPAHHLQAGRCAGCGEDFQILLSQGSLDQTQADGIVIDENVNFRQLLGYLKQFFRKMGFPQARFRPAFFPYTEPSVEIDVFHPEKKKWIEFGGAGILAFGMGERDLLIWVAK